VLTYKPYGTPVSPSRSERFEYAGEMIVSAAGTSPSSSPQRLQAAV
jgi:hypothetical protein